MQYFSCSYVAYFKYNHRVDDIFYVCACVFISDESPQLVLPVMSYYICFYNNCIKLLIIKRI